MSESKGAIGVTLKIVARNPCPTHGYTHWDGQNTNGAFDVDAWCQGGLVGKSGHFLGDMAIRAMAWGMQLNLFKTNETMQDVTGASNPETANTAITAVNIHAGSGVTAPSFTDFQIETPLSNTGTTAFVTAVMHAISGAAFTVTGTLTNSTGSTITYGNLGLEITLNSHTYLVTHDQT